MMDMVQTAYWSYPVEKIDGIGVVCLITSGQSCSVVVVISANRVIVVGNIGL